MDIILAHPGHRRAGMLMYISMTKTQRIEARREIA
jgi:hypothetical protein